MSNLFDDSGTRSNESWWSPGSSGSSDLWSSSAQAGSSYLNQSIPEPSPEDIQEWKSCGNLRGTRCDEYTPEDIAGRKAAFRHLKQFFNVIPDAKMNAMRPKAKAGLPSNSIGDDELHTMAIIYSNLELGNGALSIDTSAMKDPEKAMEYRQKLLEDVTALMQTPEGRDALRRATRKDQRAAIGPGLEASPSSLVLQERKLPGDDGDWGPYVGYNPGITKLKNDRSQRSEVALLHALGHLEAEGELRPHEEGDTADAWSHSRTTPEDRYLAQRRKITKAKR
jgi:hypothetical protein